MGAWLLAAWGRGRQEQRAPASASPVRPLLLRTSELNAVEKELEGVLAELAQLE